MKKALFLVLIVLILTPTVVRSDQTADESSAEKISRWESNLSIGSVLKRRLGIVKSFWWYPLPRILAVGLSLDYVGTAIPLSVNIALNLPTPVVVPFVCAGAGGSLTHGGITNYGGGLKFRIWKKIGIIAEYRKYSQRQEAETGVTEEKTKSDYFGAGIAYIY